MSDGAHKRTIRGAPKAKPLPPTAAEIEALWFDLEVLVRKWLPDSMEGADLGDDGALVRVVARSLRAIGPVREHTTDDARAVLRSGRQQIIEEMLHINERVIPLQMQRDDRTQEDADLVYLKARRAADLRIVALRHIVERIHHVETILMLPCGGGSVAIPIPYESIRMGIEHYRPGGPK